MRKLTVVLMLVLGLAATSAFATPPCWALQQSQSHLTFSGDQAGAPARGEFKQFDVRFCFDPDSARGHLKVVVDVASLETHNSRRDMVLKGADFFAVDRYPKAVYEARKFTRSGDGSYTAHGTLKLRDVSRTVPVTFQFSIQGNTAMVSGKTVIQRLEFDIGQGRWGNTRWVGNDVQLGFVLHFARTSQ